MLFLFFLGKNIEQYKAGIEKLGTKVGTTTAAVTEFSNHGWCKQCSIYQFRQSGVDSTFMSKLKGAESWQSEDGGWNTKLQELVLQEIAGKHWSKPTA